MMVGWRCVWGRGECGVGWSVGRLAFERPIIASWVPNWILDRGLGLASRQAGMLDKHTSCYLCDAAMNVFYGSVWIEVEF